MSESPTEPTAEATPGATRPNPLLKWGGLTVLAVVILYVLFTTVFPWIERNLSTPTLGG